MTPDVRSAGRGGHSRSAAGMVAHAIARAAGRVLERLLRWQELAAQRHRLLELNDRMLKDLGLSRARRGAGGAAAVLGRPGSSALAAGLSRPRLRRACQPPSVGGRLRTQRSRRSSVVAVVAGCEVGGARPRGAGWRARAATARVTAMASPKTRAARRPVLRNPMVVSERPYLPSGESGGSFTLQR